MAFCPLLATQLAASVAFSSTLVANSDAPVPNVRCGVRVCKEESGIKHLRDRDVSCKEESGMKRLKDRDVSCKEESGMKHLKDGDVAFGVEYPEQPPVRGHAPCVVVTCACNCCSGSRGTPGMR